MFLAVDIGNTNITLGVFDDKKLIQTLRLESNVFCNQKEYEVQLKSLLKDFDISTCTIVSVVEELSQKFKLACDNVFETDSRLFTSYRDFDIKIGIQSPETIGVDRLANVLAVRAYNRSVIVVDVGTAITFDILSKEGVFLGGVIMAGINLQFKALNKHTSKLPLLGYEVSERAIGDCTKNAILSGVIRGTASAIDGLIKQCENELEEPALIIATGGQCELISEYMSRKFDIINPNLTLEGIKLATNMNPHVAESAEADLESNLQSCSPTECPPTHVAKNVNPHVAESAEADLESNLQSCSLAECPPTHVIKKHVNLY